VPLLSLSELNAILDFCQNEHIKTAIRLAAYCGLRAEEIQRLRPEHVKKDHLWLAFEQKAGVSIETVPLPGNLKLSPGALPNGISHRMISRYFRSALAEIGRDNLRFHDLRHAYESWLVQNGVDLYLTGKLLRHKSLASTKRYAHFADEQKQNAVKKVFG
jgi:integrase